MGIGGLPFGYGITRFPGLGITFSASSVKPFFLPGNGVDNCTSNNLHNKIRNVFQNTFKSITLLFCKQLFNY